MLLAITLYFENNHPVIFFLFTVTYYTSVTNFTNFLQNNEFFLKYKNTFYLTFKILLLVTAPTSAS